MTIGSTALREKPAGASLTSLSSARAFVTIGCASKGALNTPTPTGQPSDTTGSFGCGPAVRAHVYKQTATGAQGIFLRVKATARAAIVSPVDVSSWTGTSVPTVTASSPTDGYDVRVKFPTGGTVGTTGAFYAISLDGGRTYGTSTALGTANTIVIGSTGLTLNLATGTIVTNDEVAFYVIPASGALLPRTITRAASSTATLTASGTPQDAYDVRLEWLTSCTVGTAGGTYRYSLDGGRTFTPDTPLGANNSITILDGGEDSGIAIALGAGTLDKGDTLTFGTTAPEFQVSDALTALAALRTSKFSWSWIHVAQALDTSTAGSIGTAVASWATKAKYSFIIADARPATAYEKASNWIARLVAQWSGVADTRIGLGAGMARITDPTTGRRVRRPVGWLAATRIITTAPHRDIAEKAAGALSSDVAIHDETGALVEHDAYEDNTLDTARFICLRQYPDEAGVYFASGSVMGPANDIQRLADRRVLNAIAEVLNRSLTELLKIPFKRYPSTVKAGSGVKPGDIVAADRLGFERRILTSLNTAIRDAGMVSGIQVQIDPTPVSIGQGSWKLIVRVKAYGLGYIDVADAEYGFVDPALDAILNGKGA